MITPDRLRKVLSYEPPTGVFTWLVATSRRIRVGNRAGGIGGEGYIYIRVDGRRYLAHRLAWLWMTGAWPSADTDHINGDKTDNRWANLREATRSQNNANAGRPSNNTSGWKGAIWDKRKRRWKAEIQKDGRHIFLGYYATPEAAGAAYIAAASKMYGEFARAG